MKNLKMPACLKIRGELSHENTCKLQRCMFMGLDNSRERCMETAPFMSHTVFEDPMRIIINVQLAIAVSLFRSVNTE